MYVDVPALAGRRGRALCAVRAWQYRADKRLPRPIKPFSALLSPFHTAGRCPKAPAGPAQAHQHRSSRGKPSRPLFARQLGLRWCRGLISETFVRGPVTRCAVGGTWALLLALSALRCVRVRKLGGFAAPQARSDWNSRQLAGMPPRSAATQRAVWQSAPDVHAPCSPFPAAELLEYLKSKVSQG